MEPERPRKGEEDAALDVLMTSWAERHALPSERVEAIRRDILAQVGMAADAGLAQAVLPVEWWEGFFADLHAGFRRAVSLESLVAAAGWAA